VARVPDGLLGVGVEHTRISASCCGNPPWYHHFELADGWATEGRLLGHPLGGQGREWRLTLTGAGAGGAVLHAAMVHRTRGPENLFAPDRQGRAMLYEVAADARPGSRISAELRLAAERGAGWRELHATAALRWKL
jgi:hypothetical protein